MKTVQRDLIIVFFVVFFFPSSVCSVAHSELHGHTELITVKLAYVLIQKLWHSCVL